MRKNCQKRPVARPAAAGVGVDKPRGAPAHGPRRRHRIGFVSFIGLGQQRPLDLRVTQADIANDLRRGDIAAQPASAVTATSFPGV